MKMGGGASFSWWTIAAVLTVAVMVEGQSDCVAKLVPCAQYLNSTKPSADCCSAMKQVVSTQLDCLCGLLRNPAATPGINMTQALELPKYCGVPADTSACNAQSPSSNVPPAVPGGNSGNGVGRGISWMGIPALLFVSALAFFN